MYWDINKGKQLLPLQLLTPSALTYLTRLELTSSNMHNQFLSRKIYKITIIQHVEIWKGKLLKTSTGKGFGKFHPRTGHNGPEREQMYGSTLSLTLALDRVGGWSMPCPDHSTPPPGSDPALIVWEVGWAPGPWVQKLSRPNGIRHPEPSSL
jgi:hypothetical protein